MKNMVDISWTELDLLSDAATKAAVRVSAKLLGTPVYTFQIGQLRAGGGFSPVFSMPADQPAPTKAFFTALEVLVTQATERVRALQAKARADLEAAEVARRQALAKPANPGQSHKHKGLKALSKQDKALREMRTNAEMPVAPKGEFAPMKLTPRDGSS
jgi:hypothetical protein